MALTYKLIHDERQFSDLQNAWTQLLAKSRCSTFFLQWQWQWQWWRNYGGELAIIVIEDTESSELLAIFPFVARPKTGFSELGLIGSPDSDYLDLIIKANHEQLLLAYFFQRILPELDWVGAVELDAIREDSPNRGVLEAFDLSAFKTEVTLKPCPYIDLPESWEAYNQGLSKSMRYYINRKVRKLEKTFQVTYGIADDHDWSERFEHFVRQHQKVWQQRQKPGAFKKQGFLKFHRNITPLLIENRQLKLLYLEIDGKPAASYLLYCDQRHYYFYLSGFDTDLAAFSPSVVLLSYAVKQAIAEGYQEFDLMRGSGAYKYKWTSQQRINKTWLIKKKRLKVSFYYFFDDYLKQASQQLKSLIPSDLKNGIRACLPSRFLEHVDRYFR